MNDAIAMTPAPLEVFGQRNVGRRFSVARVALVASALGLLAGCGDAPRSTAGAGPIGTEARPDGAAAPDRVTLLLNWFPEAEHGGYYAALVEGIYERHGLDVTILPGGPESPVAQRVARGDVTFGVSNADNVLFNRAQEAAVVALMAPLQTSPRCIMTHRAANIRSFDDLRDMTLAMSNSLAFSFYLRAKAPLEHVRIVPYAGSVAPFLRDPKLAQQGYVFSEPYVARRQGGDPAVLMLADLGFNPYTSVLVANENTIRSKPDLARRMVAASVEGWRRYLVNPAPTNGRLHAANPQMDLDVLEHGARAIVPLALGREGAGGEFAVDRPDVAPQERPPSETELAALGRMALDRWRTLVEQLVECGQLKPGEVDPTKAFTTEFLPK